MANSAAVLAVVLGVLALATHLRASQREAAALRAFPALGNFVTLADGTRIHYLDQGQGPDLILLHGASGSVRDFSPDLLARLALDYRVLAFDRPGMGHSDALPADNESLAAQARALREAADLLAVRDPLLAGQSYGGAVALAWALDAPPKALILISAPSMPWPGALDPWYRLTAHPLPRAILTPLVAAWLPEATAASSIPAIFGPDPVPRDYQATIGIPLALRRASLAANAAQVNALRAQLVEMQARYPGLTIPVELIHGDQDSVVPLVIHSEPLSHLLPNAALTVLPGAGHMPHHSHPDAVLAAFARARLRTGLQ